MGCEVGRERYAGKDAGHGRRAATAVHASSAGSTFGTGSTIRTTRPARLPSFTRALVPDLAADREWREFPQVGA